MFFIPDSRSLLLFLLGSFQRSAYALQSKAHPHKTHDAHGALNIVDPTDSNDVHATSTIKHRRGHGQPPTSTNDDVFDIANWDTRAGNKTKYPDEISETITDYDTYINSVLSPGKTSDTNDAGADIAHNLEDSTDGIADTVIDNVAEGFTNADSYNLTNSIDIPLGAVASHSALHLLTGYFLLFLAVGAVVWIAWIAWIAAKLALDSMDKAETPEKTEPRVSNQHMVGDRNWMRETPQNEEATTPEAKTAQRVVGDHSFVREASRNEEATTPEATTAQHVVADRGWFSWLRETSRTENAAASGPKTSRLVGDRSWVRETSQNEEATKPEAKITEKAQPTEGAVKIPTIKNLPVS